MNKLFSETTEIRGNRQKISNVLLNGIRLLKNDPSVLDVQKISNNEYIILRAYGVFNRQDILSIVETENQIEYRVDGQLLNYTISWEFETITDDVTALTQVIYINNESMFVPILSLCNSDLSKYFSITLSKIKQLTESAYRF
ncbi:hypothetical protein [Leuconostoc inhae]|uniref:hypothetical protein n=1 Tax=Leuconostoc inhae TaxID=178001 RepID=UPI001C7DA860|nr:hypothetical protein [Leuconostoc inhae]